MKKHIVAVLIVLMTAIGFCSLPVKAEETAFSFETYGTYDYKAVQAELVLLNELRAEYDLPALTLDPVMTEMAMQRAAECAVYYSHTRPNGESCFTVFDSYDRYAYGSKGENIAAGYTSESDVMTGWTNSSGHFANMTSSNYQSVGLGCFYHENGTKYWVQLFSSTTCSSPCTTNSKVSKSGIEISCLASNVDFYYSESYDCEVNIYEGATTHPIVYIQNKGFSWGSQIAVSGGYKLKSSDTSLATVSGYEIKGISAGDVTISIIFDYITINMPYSVLAKPVITYSIDSSKNITFNVEGVLDSDTKNVKVYFKEADDELWTMTNMTSANQSYTIYSSYNFTSYGDVYTCVARYWDDYYEKWVEVSDRVTAVVTLAKPEISVKTVASSGKPRVTWKAVDGASEYEVWRKVGSNGTYKKIYTTTGTSMTNKSAVAGTTYYYKVKAICSKNAAANSNFSKVKYMTCDLARPVTKLSNVASSGKPKLTWDAVDGAAKYEVWRKVGTDGTYKRIYTTTGTSMTNTSATAGTKYYYKVKAICSKTSYGNSSFSEVKSITCDLARPTVSITRNSNGKPKLSWAKISGAAKYEIYRATSKNGTYSKFYTTTKLTFTNSSAVSGKTYYYKVRAISSKTSAANSAFSSVVYKTAK